MSEPLIILPRGYATPIYDSGARYGTIDVKFSKTEQLALIDGFHISQGPHKGGRTSWIDLTTSDHALAGLSTAKGAGPWFRVAPELHIHGYQARRQSGALSLDFFRSFVSGGWRPIAPGPRTIALTCATFELEGGEKVENWAAWLLDGGSELAIVCDLEIAEETAPLLAPLAAGWPLVELADTRIAMIGLGSIGSAAAESLAAYGIRHIDLIDPDRLRWHNFARHRVDWRQLGMYKVDALAKQMNYRDPDLEIRALALDVIYDADQIRPILADSDLVLVSTDGVEARRVANHLARRAGKPAVFACVLEDGAYGELHCFQPARTGCLLCSRERLRADGAIDPESTLDLAYGQGTRHQPMTAVTGDLSLVGNLAAKIALATVLEPRGFRDQRLAGDHAVLALRPKPNRAPPFDLEEAGELRWQPLSGPLPGCPTCSP